MRFNRGFFDYCASGICRISGLDEDEIYHQCQKLKKIKSEDVHLDLENQKEQRHYIWLDTVGKPGKCQKRRRQSMDKQPRCGASNHRSMLISWLDTDDSWGILRRPFCHAWLNPLLSLEVGWFKVKRVKVQVVMHHVGSTAMWWEQHHHQHWFNSHHRDHRCSQGGLSSLLHSCSISFLPTAVLGHCGLRNHTGCILRRPQSLVGLGAHHERQSEISTSCRIEELTRLLSL